MNISVTKALLRQFLSSSILNLVMFTSLKNLFLFQLHYSSSSTSSTSSTSSSSSYVSVVSVVSSVSIQMAETLDQILHRILARLDQIDARFHAFEQRLVAVERATNNQPYCDTQFVIKEENFTYGNVTSKLTQVYGFQISTLELQQLCTLKTCTALFMKLIEMKYGEDLMKDFRANQLPVDYESLTSLAATIWNRYCLDVSKQITNATYSGNQAQMKRALTRKSSKIRYV